MSGSTIFLGFRAFLFLFFKIQRCFVDCRVKFYSSAVFFMEMWFFFLQDPIFKGLFELDLLL